MPARFFISPKLKTKLKHPQTAAMRQREQLWQKREPKRSEGRIPSCGASGLPELRKNAWKLGGNALRWRVTKSIKRNGGDNGPKSIWHDPRRARIRFTIRSEARLAQL